LRKSLKTGPILWSYLDNEKGDEIWLTFHGYSQDAEIMHQFMKTFRPNARVLSFDLPLHGDTEIKKKKLVNVGDLAELLGGALREVGGKSCSVLAYSLGGKLAMKMLELDPGKMDRLILIAPDGLKTNTLYWFVTHTLLGRWIFQLVILFPHPVIGFSKLLSVVRIMNPKVHEFVSSQMDSKAKRQKVLDTWMMFRHIKPSLDQLSKKVWRYRLKLTLVFGNKDRVIHPKLAKNLSGDNCKTAEVIMLDTGHNLITKRQAKQLKDLIK
jgi:pimeloyl-ACP methyl ester carboxylesterase